MHLPKPLITPLRNLDSQAWSTATWAAPLAVQIVLGAMFIGMWLLGKAAPFRAHGPYSGERALLLTAAAASALVSVVMSGWFITWRSARARGAALSLAGSGLVVLIGAAVIAFWLLRW